MARPRGKDVDQAKKAKEFVLHVLILVFDAYYHSSIGTQGWMQTEWVDTIKLGLS